MLANKNTKLKRCPFCGGWAELKFSYECWSAFVRCSGCFCKTAEYTISGPNSPDTASVDNCQAVQSAIRDWNSRVEPKKK